VIGREPRSHEAELQALKEMVAGEGWQIVQEHLESAWGDSACMAQIDRAIDKAAPEDELAITKRIRDTFKGVRAEARWVTQRIQELEDGIKAKTTKSVVDRFTGFRRGPTRGTKFNAGGY
jgi:hypothetical protein